MSQITITVSGATATGKSTIATVIAKMLKQHGYTVWHQVGPDGPIDASNIDVIQRSRSLAAVGNPTVTIQETTVAREPTITQVSPNPIRVDLPKYRHDVRAGA